MRRTLGCAKEHSQPPSDSNNGILLFARPFCQCMSAGRFEYYSLGPVPASPNKLSMINVTEVRGPGSESEENKDEKRRSRHVNVRIDLNCVCTTPSKLLLGIVARRIGSHVMAMTTIWWWGSL